MSAVSASDPPTNTAMSRNGPGVSPAVNRPTDVTVPPVAVYVTAGVVVVPSLRAPATVNCWMPPAVSIALGGVRITDCRVGGPSVFAFDSHAEYATMSTSPKRMRRRGGRARKKVRSSGVFCVGGVMSGTRPAEKGGVIQRRGSIHFRGRRFGLEPRTIPSAARYPCLRLGSPNHDVVDPHVLVARRPISDARGHHESPKLNGRFHGREKWIPMFRNRLSR